MFFYCFKRKSIYTANSLTFIDYYKEILSICFSYYPNISTLHYILDTNLNFFLENETFFIKKIKLFKLTNVFFK